MVRWASGGSHPYLRRVSVAGKPVGGAVRWFVHRPGLGTRGRPRSTAYLRGRTGDITLRRSSTTPVARALAVGGQVCEGHAGNDRSRAPPGGIPARGQGLGIACRLNRLWKRSRASVLIAPSPQKFLIVHVGLQGFHIIGGDSVPGVSLFSLVAWVK